MSEASFVIPRLTTERLLLREARRQDFEAYAAECADPVAMQGMAGVVDRRTAWRQFTSITGQWALTGAGWWLVELAATGEAVGTIGSFFRETQLHDGADLEMGWTVFRQHWRKGIASEAARTVLAWSFAHHDVSRVIAYIDKPNVASIGVARTLGMALEGDADFYGQTLLRFSVARR